MTYEVHCTIHKYTVYVQYGGIVCSIFETEDFDYSYHFLLVNGKTPLFFLHLHVNKECQIGTHAVGLVQLNG